MARRGRVVPSSGEGKTLGEKPKQNPAPKNEPSRRKQGYKTVKEDFGKVK